MHGLSADVLTECQVHDLVKACTGPELQWGCADLLLAELLSRISKRLL